jgi:drug/metabolite transporter (DMT)-like permease
MFRDDNIRAAMLMMAGACAFTVNDMFLKLLGQELGMFQILVLRGIAVIAVFWAMVWHAQVAFASLTRRDQSLLFIRAAAEALAAYLFFHALFNMPLANVTAILQVVPLTVALSACIFLREPLGWRRLSAILVGFLGVMLIVKPGTDTFTVASVSALGCVAMVTLRDLITRIMAPGIPSSVVAFTTAIGVFLFGVAGAWSETWVMPSAMAWAWLGGAVVFVCLGYFLVIKAMRTGEMTFAAPFRYSGLLAALVLGFLVFSEWPDTLTLIGSTIVVATGVYTLYREGQVKARARRAAALAQG